MQFDFTQEDLKERLKNNKVELFLDFLKKLQVEVPHNVKQDTQLILSLLTKQLVTSSGKTLASKALGLETFKNLYMAKKVS